MAKKKNAKTTRKKSGKKGTKRYDFKKINPVDHEGNSLNFGGIHKAIANAILRKTTTMDMLEISRQINEGKPVYLTAGDIKNISSIINDERIAMVAVIRVAFKEYVNSVK